MTISLMYIQMQIIIYMKYFIVSQGIFFIYRASSGFFTKHNNNLYPYILPKPLSMIMIIITIVSRRSYVF